MIYSDYGRELKENFEDFLEDIMNDGRPNIAIKKVSMPKIDLYETDGSFLIDAELPGFTKDEIEIGFVDGYIKINAKKEDKKEEKSECKTIKKERHVVSLSREVFIGYNVDPNKAEAELENGILKLKISKKDGNNNLKIKIK